MSASCRVPSISTDRSLPFAIHLSFDDLHCCLFSYIREFNEERLRLFHAHTCARACVSGSVNSLLSPLKRQILHSWVVCQILSDYIRLA